MEVSNAFVVFMGMGTTFVGLTCIIFLTMLMGKIMRCFEKPAPPQAASAPTPAPAMPAAAADGVTEEVKVAILAALMQQPGFRMEDVRSIDIRRV